MAVLTRITPVSFGDFFTLYANNDGFRVISSISNSLNTTHVDIIFSFLDGNSRAYRFSDSSNTTKITFSAFITLLVANISNLKFSNLDYNVIYHFFNLALCDDRWTVLSAYPYSSFLWSNIDLITGSNYRYGHQVVFQKADPWAVDIYSDYTYDDGSGFYRHTFSDVSNNSVTPQIQFIKGDTGDTGPVGPQGPAGDPGAPGGVVDISPLTSQMVVLGEKIDSLNNNIAGLAASNSIIISSNNLM